MTSTGCLDRPIQESKPVTTNVIVQKQNNTAVTAIDLLLMIDNSASMADKQTTLAVAVPELLQQLVKPQCVNAKGEPFDPPVYATLGTLKPCAAGIPEFNPVNDIHVGIITSSLGDHGEGKSCTPGQISSTSVPEPGDVNDMSHLIGTLQRGIDKLANDTGATPTASARLANQGFLAWGSDSQAMPSETDLGVARAMFKDMVMATGEKGCGYEAQLESWFRFLIDPVPPKLPLTAPVNNLTSRQGVDDELLAQRAAFLRPNSLVAIVMLTDENDCSLRDTDYGWVAASGSTIGTGSAACATNPNDPCCYTCTAHEAPKGCAWACPNPPNTTPPAENLGLNLACWQQKRRFGLEFTYPTSRYSVALSKKELCPDQSFGDMDCDCTYANSIHAGCVPGARRFPNPLYSTIVGQKSDGSKVMGYPDTIARSNNSTVFLAGIVGVPWQDISEPDSQTDGKVLKYIPVTDARWNKQGGIWDQISADYNDHEKLPLDPRMVESIRPRVGMPDPNSAVGADPIIGHDFNTENNDLEYACIYRLPDPKKCECDTSSTTYNACISEKPNDCCRLTYTDQSESFKRPLCQDPATGSYDTGKQYFAKGYPGGREIAVLRDYATTTASEMVAGNSIVASICPKDLSPSTQTGSAGYGYNPAVAALIDRLKDVLKGSCLPRPLSPDVEGNVACNVVEAISKDALGNRDCASYCTSMKRNREVSGVNPTGGPSENMRAAVVKAMQQSTICDSGPDSPKCSDMCLCLLSQESKTENTTGSAAGSDLAVCQNVNDGTETGLPPGYCYVDPELVDGAGNPLAGNNPEIVARCPESQKRILRYVGNNPSAGVPVPLPNAFVFTACQGSAL